MPIVAVHRVASLLLARKLDVQVRQAGGPHGLLVVFVFGDDDQTDSPLRQAAQFLLFLIPLSSRLFLQSSRLFLRWRLSQWAHVPDQSAQQQLLRGSVRRPVPRQ